MDDYSSIASDSQTSVGYSAESVGTYNSDYDSEQADEIQDHQSLPGAYTSEGEGGSEGGLFVEQDRSSAASIISLSASEQGSSHTQNADQRSPRLELGPGFVNGFYLGNDPDEFDHDYELESELERELARGNTNLVSSDSEGTVGQEPIGSPNPLHVDAHEFPLFDHQNHESDDSSEESEELDFEGHDFDDELDDDHLFGEDFGDSDEEDFGEEEGDAEFLGLPEPVPHHHHHHHLHHHHFHHPRLPAVHPDRHSPIVLGINPLQHFGPNFLPPHLHEHLRRASSSPGLSPNALPRMDVRSQQRDELVGVELGRGRASSAQHNNVIDLTLDDEDVEIISGSQNARRQQSQRRSVAPRLNRSDGSYVGNRNVIELSSDSEDDVQIHRVNIVGQQQQQQPNAAAAAPNHHRHHHRHVHHHHAAHHHHHHTAAVDHAAAISRQQRRIPANNAARAADNINRGFLNMAMNGIRGVFNMANRRGDDGDVLIMGGGPLPIPNMPNLQHIQLNYEAHPFHPPPPAPGPQKPKHEPPPKAREGFTRDTEEDNPVICPSCDEELAFDPDEEDENGPPAKKARTKKDKAEHHFWAVKECGHVFCKKCYENRKPTLRNPVKVGFTAAPDNNKKIFCAVDGCKSDVSSKTAWVGIFM